MTSVWKSRTRLILLVLGVLMVGSLLWAQGRAGLKDRLVRNFVAAADQSGRPVRAEETMVIVRKSGTFITAPLRGYERVPATRVTRGVEFAYAYVDAPKSGIPEGNYTLRAVAPEVKLGEISGRVEFVDANGKVAKRVPATLQVKSLTVPNPLPFPNTRTLGGLQLGSSPSPTAAAAAETAEVIYVWELCPNGLWICYIIIFDE